jgi:hypothetical protein
VRTAPTTIVTAQAAKPTSVNTPIEVMLMNCVLKEMSSQTILSLGAPWYGFLLEKKNN